MAFILGKEDSLYSTGWNKKIKFPHRFSAAQMSCDHERNQLEDQAVTSKMT